MARMRFFITSDRPALHGYGQGAGGVGMAGARA